MLDDVVVQVWKITVKRSRLTSAEGIFKDLALPGRTDGWTDNTHLGLGPSKPQPTATRVWEPDSHAGGTALAESTRR